MDLDALKNLNVKDFLEKIKSGGGADLLKDKKTLIKFGSVAGAILFFLIVYYAFVSPIIGAQKERLDVMNENQNTVDEYLNNINTLEARVKELEPQYKKSSKLFHSKKEVEDLYQNISNYAMTNGLSIINIKKGEPTPASSNENSGENTEDQAALYYKIPVNYKIQGNYLGYLKFRRALAKSSKVINYDKETITVDAKSGTIVSEGTISIVGLPNEYKK